MLLARVFARLVSEGHLTIIDAAGRRHEIGDAHQGPSVTIRIHDRLTGIRIALRPRIALGEAYMDGTLTVEDGDIYDLLDLLGRNMARIDNTPAMRLSFGWQRVIRFLLQHNPIGRAQRNHTHTSPFLCTELGCGQADLRM